MIQGRIICFNRKNIFNIYTKGGKAMNIGITNVLWIPIAITLIFIIIIFIVNSIMKKNK